MLLRRLSQHLRRLRTLWMAERRNTARHWRPGAHHLLLLLLLLVLRRHLRRLLLRLLLLLPLHLQPLQVLELLRGPWHLGQCGVGFSRPRGPHVGRLNHRSGGNRHPIG